MRHLNSGRSLSRSPSHRKALLANLAQELFQHKRIRTTLAKAKELRPYAEKLVTTAKKGHLAARRSVARFLTRPAVIKSLFEEIAPAFAERNGGYTRIIKLANRIGDNAPLAIIELVGYEGVVAAKAAEVEKAEKKKALTGKKPAVKRPKKAEGEAAKEKKARTPRPKKEVAGKAEGGRAKKAPSVKKSGER